MKQLPDLQFKYGTYESLDGYWVEIESVVSHEVISGGHFNSKKDVYDFFLRSKKYFNGRLIGEVSIHD